MRIKNINNILIKDRKIFWTWYQWFFNFPTLLIAGNPGVKIYPNSELGWITKYNEKWLEKINDESELGWFVYE